MKYTNNLIFDQIFEGTVKKWRRIGNIDRNHVGFFVCIHFVQKKNHYSQRTAWVSHLVKLELLGSKQFKNK